MPADLRAASTADPVHAVMLESIDTGLYYGPFALGETGPTTVRPLPQPETTPGRAPGSRPPTPFIGQSLTAAVENRARTGLPLEAYGITDSVA